MCIRDSYKAAHLIDHSWSVRDAGLRQRHIDQAQSMNLYITNDYSMRQVLRLYLEAWRVGVKTIYYVRSKALEVCLLYTSADCPAWSGEIPIRCSAPAAWGAPVSYTHLVT